VAELFADPVLGDLLRNTIDELGERLDGGLLPALYRVASVPPGVVRAHLDAAGLAYTDAATGRLPSLTELDATAQRVVAEASRGAALRGAAAAFGGLTTLAPEALAALVQSLRLAQRLAVIYGHDPDTDRGRVLLTRALAQAWNIDLPADGSVSSRLRQLPDVVRSRLRGTPRQLSAIARVIARRAFLQAGKRVGRLIPGFGSTLGAASARRDLRRQGAAMADIYRRAWQGDPLLDGEILDADELA